MVEVSVREFLLMDTAGGAGVSFVQYSHPHQANQFARHIGVPEIFQAAPTELYDERAFRVCAVPHRDALELLLLRAVLWQDVAHAPHTAVEAPPHSLSLSLSLSLPPSLPPSVSISLSHFPRAPPSIHPDSDLAGSIAAYQQPIPSIPPHPSTEVVLYPVERRIAPVVQSHPAPPRQFLPPTL